MRNLLTILARRSLNQLGERVRVQEIATQGFGRSADFGPQTDSAVRVHTGRFRSKLAEYYLGESAGHELILAIPRGSYQLTWRYRSAAPWASPAPAPSPRQDASQPEAAAAAGPSGRKLLLVAGLLTAAAAGFLGGKPWSRRGQPAPTSALQVFWRGFVTGKQETLVIFSNRHSFVFTFRRSIQVRHPPRSGWLDELGRLKGGRPRV